jgi:hypothetical protein
MYRQCQTWGLRQSWFGPWWGGIPLLWISDDYVSWCDFLGSCYTLSVTSVVSGVKTLLPERSICKAGDSRHGHTGAPAHLSQAAAQPGRMRTPVCSPSTERSLGSEEVGEVQTSTLANHQSLEPEGLLRAQSQ